MVQTAWHTTSCIIFEKCVQQGGAVFSPTSPGTHNGRLCWMTKKQEFYVRERRGPEVCTEEAEEVDHRGQKKKKRRSCNRKKTEDRLQQRNVSEFVGARKTSLDTRNLTAGSRRTCLPGYLQPPSRRWGEKKMMATLSAIMDNTSHPPHGSVCPGRLCLWRAAP